MKALHRTGQCIALLGLLAAPAATVRAQEICQFDTARSQVHFTLGDVLHTVHGNFQLQQGSSVLFKRKTGEMSGMINVDATSGVSGNGMRDRRMTRDELKSEKFSLISFVPSHFDGTLQQGGMSALKVQGQFTLLGSAHPLTLDMHVRLDGNACHVEGSFALPYVAWGLKDPSTLILRVNKEVQIDLSLEGKLQQ